MSIQDKMISVLTDFYNSDSRVAGAWIEGSLAIGRGNPASDIDLRVVVFDDFYGFDNLELLPFESNVSVMASAQNIGAQQFIRVICDNGIVIDLDVYKVSDLPVSVPEYKVICDKIGMQIMDWSARDISQDYPCAPIDQVELYRLTTDICVVITSVPTMFFNVEPQSYLFQLDLLRAELIKIMYRLRGVEYAKRYKHFRELFSDEWLNKLSKTYPSDMSPHSIARTYLYTCKTLGEFLDFTSNSIGGGFNHQLFWTVFGKLSKELEKF